MIGEYFFEPSGHEGGIASGFEEVVEVGKMFIAGGTLVDKAAANAATERRLKQQQDLTREVEVLQWLFLKLFAMAGNATARNSHFVAECGHLITF
jgi:uncharacterized protein YjaG (DUF416 family)